MIAHGLDAVRGVGLAVRAVGVNLRVEEIEITERNAILDGNDSTLVVWLHEIPRTAVLIRVGHGVRMKGSWRCGRCRSRTEAGDVWSRISRGAAEGNDMVNLLPEVHTIWDR